jgi:uncharacterized protein involved in exopolysaccharide biosynthesis
MIPELSIQYSSMLEEIKLKQIIYGMLRQEYEKAKIEEANTTKVFQIIEKAEVPEVKSGPSRSRICLVMTVAAFIVSVIIAFYKEYIEKVRNDPEDSEKLGEIKRMLFRLRNRDYKKEKKISQSNGQHPAD